MLTETRLGAQGRLMADTASFEGLTAIVTGGSSGIGAAVAADLAARGARVVVWDLAEPAGPWEHARLDVADEAAVDAAAARAEAEGATFDVLVHSAGLSGPTAPAHEFDYDPWSRVVDVNLKGTFLVNRACLRRMRARGYGRVVNIASIAGKEGNPGASAYSASKAGVIALTKSLGKENADLDIAVNCVTPAAARTPILEQVSQEFVDYMLSKIPRGRFLELPEIVSMIRWMASAENSFTTGAVFDISGGRATY